MFVKKQLIVQYAFKDKLMLSFTWSIYFHNFVCFLSVRVGLCTCKKRTVWVLIVLHRGYDRFPLISCVDQLVTMLLTMKSIQLIAKAILDSFSVGSAGRQTSSKSRLTYILNCTQGHTKAQRERLLLLGPSLCHRLLGPNRLV